MEIGFVVKMYYELDFHHWAFRVSHYSSVIYNYTPGKIKQRWK